MPQSRLDGLVIDAQGVKVRCKAATEGVPAVPQRQCLVALIDMVLWLERGLWRIVVFLGVTLHGVVAWHHTNSPETGGLHASRSSKRGREKRDYATLDYLATQLIDSAPSQPIPVLKILEVMGEPDSLVDRCCTFFSKDQGKQTGYLYLEVDNQGKVTGWKLDNIS